MMKTIGSLILLLSIVMLPFSVCAAENDGVKKIVGVIVEKSDKGDRLQIGNYLVSNIAKVVIKDDGKEDKIGKTEDLFLGALVIAELTKQDENGFWGASAIALILGSKQDKALAEFSEDEQDAIRKTQENFVATDETKPADAEEVKTPAPSEGEMRLENGVWVN